MGRDITRCSEAELRELKAELDRQYAGYVAQNLKLDMSRGKPSGTQLNLTNGILDKLDSYVTGDGVDARNYGGLEGIPEARLTIISRYVSLGSLVMMTGFLVEFIIFAVNGMIPGLYPAELVEAVVIVAILTVLAFWRHRANIVRLVHGNERRLWGGNKEKNSN